MIQKTEIKRLTEKDFPLVDNFYKTEIGLLLNKRHFFPYTEQELKEILSEGGGYFIGVFFGDELLGVSAIDFDREYGEVLKKQMELKTDLPVFELSGLFVSSKYRGKGVASLMITSLIDYARKNLPPSYLCGMVEESNTASKLCFICHGFTLEKEVKNSPFDFCLYKLKN